MAADRVVRRARNQHVLTVEHRDVGLRRIVDVVERTDAEQDHVEYGRQEDALCDAAGLLIGQQADHGVSSVDRPAKRRGGGGRIVLGIRVGKEQPLAARHARPLRQRPRLTDPPSRQRRTGDDSRRGDCAARWSSMARVASSDSSSTTITSKSGCRVASKERTQRSICRSSLRAGTTIDTLGRSPLGSLVSMLDRERRTTSNDLTANSTFANEKTAVSMSRNVITRAATYLRSLS